MLADAVGHSWRLEPVFGRREDVHVDVHVWRDQLVKHLARSKMVSEVLLDGLSPFRAVAGGRIFDHDEPSVLGGTGDIPAPYSTLVLRAPGGGVSEYAQVSVAGEMSIESQAIWDWEFTHQLCEVPQRVVDAYRQLDDAQGRALARHTLDLIEVTPADGREHLARREAGLNLVARLACFVPGVLQGMHSRLVGQGLHDEFGAPMSLDPHVAFHRADADARDLLISSLGDASIALSDGRYPGTRLESLAWVDDDVVREVFSSWIRSPPSWLPSRYTGSAAEWLSWIIPVGGWTFNSAGERRGLTRPGCCDLVEGGDPLAASVGGQDEERCGWCGLPLTVLLDLGIADERLGFLSLPGSRLRMLTCELCIGWTTVFIDVDGDGAARWADCNEPPSRRRSADEMDPDDLMPRGIRTLGRATRSPLEPMALAYYIEVSHVGGIPTWVQHAEYPRCPRCDELMPFLGQVDTSEVAWGEGTIYAFHDADCGLAASLYQQT